MNFLVDTNILSALTKKLPQEGVPSWFAENQGSLYVSSITIGELRFGIELLPDGERREMLNRWLAKTVDIMGCRVLSFNRGVAHVWGQLRARLRAEGLELPTIDGQLAATAVRHSLVIATRNISDFEPAGVDVFNPFDL